MANGKRHAAPSVEEPLLPFSDHPSWFYPSHGYDSSDEEIKIHRGNWGKKTMRRARWARKGKLAAWGPGIEEWEAEERARKRVKALLQEKRSPSPPCLPHLRDPSPPLTPPYPGPVKQHLRYTSFVMDKAVTRTFRSPMLDELEQATSSLIEDEGKLRKALGRLWQAIRESPDSMPSDAPVVPKQEDEDERDHDAGDEDSRPPHSPDLTPAVNRIFLSYYPVSDPSQFTSPEMQMETMNKALSMLRELHDDGREYVERLQEIREGLGEARAQRDTIWNIVRERAVAELQFEARAIAG